MEMTSRKELEQYKIDRISDAHRPLLSTVDWVDNSVDCWIKCINDLGQNVKIIPDKTGWNDGRREIFVMNCDTGENCKLFFEFISEYGYESAVPHTVTLDDRHATEEVMWKLPFPVMFWAIKRAH